MAELLYGAPVAAALTERVKAETAALASRGVMPGLAVVRAGERRDDIAYENAVRKRCETAGIKLRRELLSEDVPSDEIQSVIRGLGEDRMVHGILLFRPLPGHLDENAICALVRPQKDVDGIAARSMAGVYSGNGFGFPPCTARACIELLEFYGIDLTGLRVTVVGRSLVVGKPAAMMLLSKNATVTVCHTRTKDLEAECRRADVLVVAAGRTAAVGAEHMARGQTVIDVGVNADDDGNIRGDVDFAAAMNTVRAITPVPGGVGAVTTAVLVAHVAEAAKRAAGL